jgi:hypothetical protein
LENKLGLLDKDTDEYNIIESKIEKWTSLTDDESNTIEQIKILYNYKIEAFINPNDEEKIEFNIPLDVVMKNLDLTIDINKKGKKNDEIIKIEKNIMQFSEKINDNYFFSFDSVNQFLVSINIDKIYGLKMHFNHILNCTQKIYEKYIKIIEDYKDSIINKLSLDKTKIKDDIEQKYKNNYDKKIEKRNQKNKDLKKEIKKKDEELVKLREEIAKQKLNEYLDSDLENQADESEIDI